MIKSNLTPSSGDAVFDAAIAAMTGQTLDPVTAPPGAGAADDQGDLFDFHYIRRKDRVPPNFLMEIGGVPMMPEGCITAITGASKSGKTQFLAAVVATLLSGRDFGTLRRLQAPSGPIVWFDTEQCEFIIDETVSRIYRQAGIPDDACPDDHGLSLFATTPCTAAKRRLYIEQAVERLHPSLLIIDNCRELLDNFNDINESNELVAWALKALSENPTLRIMWVLHVNPGSVKMRGHLGTELEHKFQDCFVLSRENFDVFKAQHSSRWKVYHMPYMFCIDANGNLAAASTANVTIEDALRRLAPHGMQFDAIVTQVAQITSMSKASAKNALKARMSADPRPYPRLDKRADGLFYLVDGQ